MKQLGNTFTELANTTFKDENNILTSSVYNAGRDAYTNEPYEFTQGECDEEVQLAVDSFKLSILRIIEDTPIREHSAEQDFEWLINDIFNKCKVVK